jgi:GNAT superfamily N-acetyltransferase
MEDILNQNVLNQLRLFLIKNKYKNVLKELTLEHCTDEDGEYIYLVCIRIKKSQQLKGYGAAVMSEVLQLADKHNVRIRLYATNIFGAELKRLYSFYQKLGFVLIKKCNDGEMLYYPSKKKKKL